MYRPRFICPVADPLPEEEEGLTVRKMLTQVAENIGKEPVVFWEETWDVWKSEAIMRGSIQQLAEAMNYNVWWVRQLCELQGAFVLPQFVRELCIDFTSSKWEVAVFSPKDYNWRAIKVFLTMHFRQYVKYGDQFTIIELKNMILHTYPDRSSSQCFDMAANLVDEFSDKEDAISFEQMLGVYKGSLEDSPEQLFKELEVLGFSLEQMTMSLPDISDRMLECLQQLDEIQENQSGAIASSVPDDTTSDILEAGQAFEGLSIQAGVVNSI